MRPRVLINGRFLTQPVTGVQRFATEIAIRITDRRDDVAVAAPRGHLEQRLGPLVQAGRFHGQLWEQLDLPGMVRELGNPLVLSLTNTGPLRVGRQIVTQHDITRIRYPQSYSRRFRLTYRAITGPLVRRSAAVVTVSDFSRGEIAGHFGVPAARIVVVPNAAGEAFRPAAHSGAGYLLAVASPSAHKNLGLLLEAYRQYRELVADPLPLHLAGTPTGHLRGDVPRRDVPGVRDFGRVSDAQLVDLYQQATVFVFPSLYEGFGLPALEAQQCGVPVVAARSGALTEVLADSALLVDPHDPGALAAALRDLAADTDARHALRERGLANARRFDWDRSAAVVDDLISRVLGSTP